jgi:hypothetical protein
VRRLERSLALCRGGYDAIDIKKPYADHFRVWHFLSFLILSLHLSFKKTFATPLNSCSSSFHFLVVMRTAQAPSASRNCSGASFRPISNTNGDSSSKPNELSLSTSSGDLDNLQMVY